MAKQDKTIEYVGDSRVPAKRVPNISPSYSEFPGKNEPFWPNFLLKEWMVAAVALVAFLILTVSHPAPLVEQADPTNTSFTPLPDWYFLFLFQLLKYPWAAGDWTLIGILVVPGLLFGALFLAPFLDRGPDRHWTKRPVSTGLMFIGIIAFIYLTWAAMDEHHAKHPPKDDKAPHQEAPAAPAPAADGDPGAEVWAKQMNCQGCHGVDMTGGNAPGLTTVGANLSAEEIKEVIVNGRGAMPGGLFTGSEAELDQLVEYLAGLK